MDKFPLHWPTGYARTNNRKKSAFKTSGNNAQEGLCHEIKLMGAHSLIVSTNVHVRSDGMIYSDGLGRNIDDPGVAIYFKYKKQDIAMCCDQYLTVGENIHALAKSIEAIRGMERWGVSDFIERAFTGFTALPEGRVYNLPAKKEWYEILEVKENASVEEIKNSYHKKAKEYHPDAGGSNELFTELTNAYKEGLSKNE